MNFKQFLEEGTGTFAPPQAKMRAIRKALDLPAAQLMKPEVWDVILSALADKLTHAEINLLSAEIAQQLKA